MSAGRFVVRAAVRREGAYVPAGAQTVAVGDLAADTAWQSTLTGAQVVVHLAARVHIMHDPVVDALAAFSRANVDGTLNLARQAANAGVNRFVFLSSVKVNGEGRTGAYREDDPPEAQDAYGKSKQEAERALCNIASETGMELVIIRSPLVYGPGVKANFKSLMRAVTWGIPLPLGAIRNRRSLVALDNLIDFIVICMEHPAAANQFFLVSDGEDLSTPELIRRLAGALGRRARLLPIPEGMLMAVAAILGRQADAKRLVGSLQVDITKARQLLGWVPPVSVDDGLRRVAEHYLNQQNAQEPVASARRVR